MNMHPMKKLKTGVKPKMKIKLYIEEYRRKRGGLQIPAERLVDLDEVEFRAMQKNMKEQTELVKL